MLHFISDVAIVAKIKMRFMQYLLKGLGGKHILYYRLHPLAPTLYTSDGATKLRVQSLRT